MHESAQMAIDCLVFFYHNEPIIEKKVLSLHRFLVLRCNGYL